MQRARALRLPYACPTKYNLGGTTPDIFHGMMAVALLGRLEDNSIALPNSAGF